MESTQPQADAVLSSGAVAQLFGVSNATVIRWADTGKLPAFKTPGGHYRFHHRDVNALRDSMRVRSTVGTTT